MIIDKIENIDLYKGFQTRLDLALEYLKSNSFDNLKIGKHQIQGDEIFLLMNKYETKSNSSDFLEIHKKYIDVQFMIEGSEIIDYAPFNNQEIVKEYDDEGDYSFYKENDVTHLVFKSGMFAIFLPTDLHMPGVIDKTTSLVKKIVIKVLID